MSVNGLKLAKQMQERILLGMKFFVDDIPNKKVKVELTA